MFIFVNTHFMCKAFSYHLYPYQSSCHEALTWPKGLCSKRQLCASRWAYSSSTLLLSVPQLSTILTSKFLFLLQPHSSIWHGALRHHSKGSLPDNGKSHLLLFRGLLHLRVILKGSFLLSQRPLKLYIYHLLFCVTYNCCEICGPHIICSPTDYYKDWIFLFFFFWCFSLSILLEGPSNHKEQVYTHTCIHMLSSYYKLRKGGKKKKQKYSWWL